ncbi:MAG: glutathione peroxidase [Bacillus thermozeamaize]|mgnify:FL=1|uniref:Glutathione peroxidase n=1 Tax=Bacillus thermozeamaize TaxID=230954 RepID=A0A1Y3PBF2_9BACI|nr:MAG: glutathione peroxidase [Bacillus thermozeamaize]
MSVHQFDVQTVNGETKSLSEYKGKVLLIVNTASKCGFTPQYEGLQKLYDKFKEHDFEVLAFPCNQFGGQEPGTSEEAAAFCQVNYGVTFPVFAKVEVNGPNAHPLFQYLKNQAPFKGFDEENPRGKRIKEFVAENYPEFYEGNEIKWNFTKFLIDRNGQVTRRYEPYEEPMNFEQDIAQLVQAP